MDGFGYSHGVLGQVSRAVKYRYKRTFVQLYKVYTASRHGPHTPRLTRTSWNMFREEQTTWWLGLEAEVMSRS